LNLKIYLKCPSKKVKIRKDVITNTDQRKNIISNVGINLVQIEQKKKLKDKLELSIVVDISEKKEDLLFLFLNES